jgi:hypothetical protein
MPATLTTANDLLKEVYRGQLREQLNQEQVALKRIQSSSAGISNEIGGKYVTYPIHTGRNNGIGSRREGGALPIPGQQAQVAARVGLKYAYGAIGLTGQVMALTDSNPQAFAKALDVEMNNIKLDLGKDMNRQVYGTGNGAIATVRATSGTNVIPVADARLVQFGEKIDIIRLSSGAYASTVLASSIATPITVTNIDLTAGANTITISSGTPTIAVGDIVVRSGSGIDAQGNIELTGLAAIISDTGTLFNVDPTVQPVWKATNNNNGGTNRALSEGLMVQTAHAVRQQGGRLSLMLTSLGVFRSYFNLLSQTRSTVNSQDFKGGFTGLSFSTDLGELPLVPDPDAPLNTIWFLNEDSFTYYRDQEWDWIDIDGSIWKQNVDANGRYDSLRRVPVRVPRARGGPPQHARGPQGHHRKLDDAEKGRYTDVVPLLLPLGLAHHQQVAFIAQVEEVGDCYLWTGSTTGKGYAYYGLLKPTTQVLHRRLWLEHRGHLDAKDYLDHRCRHRNCINLDHCEPTTNRENVLRGVGPSAQNFLKEFCPKNHPYDDENTYTLPNGARGCRECRRQQSRAWKARRKAK